MPSSTKAINNCVTVDSKNVERTMKFERWIAKKEKRKGRKKDKANERTKDDVASNNDNLTSDTSHKNHAENMTSNMIKTNRSDNLTSDSTNSDERTRSVFVKLQRLERKISKTGHRLEGRLGEAGEGVRYDFTSYDELDRMVDSIINVMYEICKGSEQQSPQRQRGEG